MKAIPETSPFSILWQEDLATVVPITTTLFGVAAILGAAWLYQPTTNTTPQQQLQVNSPQQSHIPLPMRSSQKEKLESKQKTSTVTKSKVTAVVSSQSLSKKRVQKQTVPSKRKPQARHKIASSNRLSKREILGDCPPLFTLYFGRNKRAPFHAPHARLKTLVSWLRAHPKTTLEVRGHADGKGAKAYNLLLSFYRANTVSRLLLRAGLPRHRMQIRAFGNLQRNSTSSPHQRTSQRIVSFQVPGYSACPIAVSLKTKQSSPSPRLKFEN